MVYFYVIIYNLDKERSGSFILEGYEEAKEGSNPVVTKTFKFTQYVYTPELTPIDVNPTSLNFDGNGGEKILTLNTKDYKYYGGFCDEASDEWLSVVINDNKTLTVKAKANDTGAERYGTIYAYGSDIPNPKTLDQVGFKAIPVTQAAGGGGSNSISDFLTATVFLDLNNSVTQQHSYQGEVSNGILEYWVYRCWGETKSDVISQLNYSSYTDVHINTYDIVTKREGQDMVLNINVDYNYIYAKKEKNTVTQKVLVKLRGDGTGDIKNYKVVYCSCDTKRRTDDITSHTYDYTEEIDNYTIEADIPYYTDYDGYYSFRLEGNKVQKNYFTQFYHLKDREWQNWSSKYGAGEKYSEKYTNSLVSINPSDKNLIEIRLHYK